MKIEEIIKFTIRCVADRAWEIATESGDFSVCTRIEDLSDDPIICDEIVEEVMRAIKGEST